MAALLPGLVRGAPFPAHPGGISIVSVLGWGRHFQPFLVSAQSLEVESCFLLCWLKTRQTFPEAV